VTTPDLVVLGNLLVDDVVLPDGTTRMAQPGGAVLYTALAAALWHVGTGIVSWRGDDYPAWALEALESRGVHLDGVHAIGGPGVRTWLLYEGRRRRVVHRLDGPTHAAVSPGPAQVPEAWRRPRVAHLAPMPLESQESLVPAFQGPGTMVSVDPHVPLGPTTLDRWRALLAGADLLLLSEDDVEGAGTEDVLRPLVASLGARLRAVLFKQGRQGGRAYVPKTGAWTRWTPRASRVVDPTGAGDAFAAGVLAGLLRGDGVERAIGRGVVSASFALEDWGPAGLLTATPGAAEARLREWAL
jgi:ribokinase